MDLRERGGVEGSSPKPLAQRIEEAARAQITTGEGWRPHGKSLQVSRSPSIVYEKEDLSYDQTKRMSITPMQKKKEPEETSEESKTSHVTDMLAIVIQGNQSADRQMEEDLNAMNGYNSSFGKQVSNMEVRHS